MKKKECPSCAMESDANHKKCPICGYEFPERSPLMIIGVIILIVIVFWYLVF